MVKCCDEFNVATSPGSGLVLSLITLDSKKTVLSSILVEDGKTLHVVQPGIGSVKELSSEIIVFTVN